MIPVVSQAELVAVLTRVFADKAVHWWACRLVQDAQPTRCTCPTVHPVATVRCILQRELGAPPEETAKWWNSTATINAYGTAGRRSQS